MDALGFTRELKRMCKFYYDAEKGYCSDNCPARNLDCMSLDQPEEDIERIIEVVKSWSQANPRKTRQDLILEQWPNAQTEFGVLKICPRVVMGLNGWRKDGCGGVLCVTCRRDFWSHEVE